MTRARHTHGCPGYTQNGIQHPCPSDAFVVCHGRNGADPGDVPFCEYEADAGPYEFCCEGCYDEVMNEMDREQRAAAAALRPFRVAKGA